MEEKIKNKAIEILNSGLKDKIIDIVRSELGMDVTFEISADYYPWSQWVILMFETSNTSAKQLTCTPLLKQMFSDAKLSVKVYYDGEDKFNFKFKIVYTHNFNSGTNSVDIMTVNVDGDNIEVEK